MSAIKAGCMAIRASHARQRGATVVEFALIVIVFLTFIFGIVEVARLMFAFNTLQESTRRAASAAATSGFGNTGQMDDIRRRAIFRNDAGFLPLMPEVTDRAIRIDYMWMQLGSSGGFTLQAIPAGSEPASAMQNKNNCILDPYSSSCVQFVRVRVCDPQNTAECTPVNFKALTSIVTLPIPLPLATTIVRAQSLGYSPN